MAVGYKNTSVSTQGLIEKGWYQGRECKVIHQRCVVTDNATSVKIGPALPSNAKIIAAHLVAHSAVAVDGTATATASANAVGLINAGTSTAATSGVTTNAASANLIVGLTQGISTQIASNARAVVHPAFEAIVPVKYTTIVNTSTNGHNLFLVPMCTDGNDFVNTNMAFNGTANVDVTVYIEEYGDRYVSLHSPAA